MVKFIRSAAAFPFVANAISVYARARSASFPTIDIERFVDQIRIVSIDEDRLQQPMA